MFLGEILFIYQLSLEDGNITNELKEVGYYINLFNILRIGFLNSSVVFCLDKTYGIKILNSSKVNQGKINFSDGKGAELKMIFFSISKLAFFILG